ncbi:hypothetical protein L6452_38314 [Arctium lappa]|uniref:Uncharacterized protein n=1 Tax=Arctium lappa TaxID=4217 RepID=A0ACB8Y4L4_ARCLA|nr:hypothetical protein L6452_38314 [Arctium lappa]
MPILCKRALFVSMKICMCLTETRLVHLPEERRCKPSDEERRRCSRRLMEEKIFRRAHHLQAVTDFFLRIHYRLLFKEFLKYEKRQDVLGHCQKEFEGEVSAENLGKLVDHCYGGFGVTVGVRASLRLPRLIPWGPPARTLRRLEPATSREEPEGPDDKLWWFLDSSCMTTRGGHQNSVSQSSESQPARHRLASFSAGPLPTSREGYTNGSLTEVPTSPAMCGNISTSNAQHVHNFTNASDQKSLKVRIEVGIGNWSTRRNAKIYSGLGLDVSPSSSFEGYPVGSDRFFHVPQDGPNVSPTSILEIMMVFPVSGSLLLSPLPYDLLHLIEKEKVGGCCGSVHYGSQESVMTVLHVSDSGKVEQNVLEEKKQKSSQRSSVSTESIDGNGVCIGVGILVTRSLTEMMPQLGRFWKLTRILMKTCSVFSRKANSYVSMGSRTLDSGLEDDDNIALQKPSGDKAKQLCNY